MPGAGEIENTYWETPQGLAEAGYVVLSFDPQGQGLSDVAPNPTSTYCDPEGSWREPQEMGIAEQGPCAGQDPPPPPGGIPLPFGGMVLFWADLQTNRPDFDHIASSFGPYRPRFTFGALDAVEWLLSGENPSWSLVDATRVGIVGHSAGSDAAAHAGNGDPLRRFAAAVALDMNMDLLASVPPRVPTMFQSADLEMEMGPYREPPDLSRKRGPILYAQFRDAGVDSMMVALASSGHQEWGYVPHPILNPFITPVGNASRLGGRVGLYYTLAWLDRYLKGEVTAAPRGDEAAQRADAAGRLAAEKFDGSADRSSIGQGTYDPQRRQNVPYTIGGRWVRDALSFYLGSSYAFDGRHCDDMRAGCEP